jgi:type IV secretory pathway VirB10-like protein
MFASLAKFAFDAAQENAEKADAGNTTTTGNQESSTIFTDDNVKYAAIGLGAAAVVAGAAYWYVNRDKAEAPKTDATASKVDGKNEEPKTAAKPTEAKAAPEATTKSDDPAARARQAEEDLAKAVAAAQDLLKKGPTNDSGEAKAA